VVNEAPFGRAFGSSILSFQYGDFNYTQDLAIITLDRPVGGLTGWFGMEASDNCSIFTGRDYVSAGYPGGSYNGEQMVSLYGRFDRCENGVAVFPEITFNGQSGSGFWEKDDRVIRTVLSGAIGGEDYGPVIDKLEFDEMSAFVNDSISDTVDLVPLGMNADKQITAGESFGNLRFRLLNNSKHTFNGDIRATVYLSSNSSISIYDTVVGSFTWSNLNFDIKSTRILNITSAAIPDNVPADTYFLGVIVEAVSGEQNTQNNISSVEDVWEIEVLPAKSGSCDSRILLDQSVSGIWSSSCLSNHRSERFAKYYIFYLPYSRTVTIDLKSSTDPYLYLLSREIQNSSVVDSVIDSNDDSNNTLNSRIVRTLSAGTYVVEATTFSAGATGDFTLLVQ
jgi:hypothetical protein